MYAAVSHRCFTLVVCINTSLLFLDCAIVLVSSSTILHEILRRSVRYHCATRLTHWRQHHRLQFLSPNSKPRLKILGRLTEQSNAQPEDLTQKSKPDMIWSSRWILPMTMARAWKSSDGVMNKIHCGSRCSVENSSQPAGCERAGEQYEHAARDEIQSAFANTTENVRSNLISQLVQIEQQAEARLSAYQIALLSGMNRSSECALGNQRRNLVTEAVDSVGLTSDRTRST